MSSATIAWLLLVAVIATLQGTDASLPDGLAGDLERHIRAVAGADFDARVKEFVSKKAKEVGRTVTWYDAYGKHQHLRERSYYDQYQVRAEVNQVQYKKMKQRTVDHPNSVYSQWFHNSQARQPLVSKIEKSIKKANTFSWTVQKNINVGLSVTAWAGIPGFLDVNANLSASLDLRKTDTETKATEETFTIAYTITVDPNTSLKAEWVITDREIEIPWEADVVLTGYIAVWYETQHNGHWLWFYPVSNLQGGDFAWHPKGLSYRSKGTFKGIIGVDSVVRTEEYPLIGASMRNGQEEDAIFERMPLKTSTMYLRHDGQTLHDEEHGEDGD